MHVHTYARTLVHYGENEGLLAGFGGLSLAAAAGGSCLVSEAVTGTSLESRGGRRGLRGLREREAERRRSRLRRGGLSDGERERERARRRGGVRDRPWRGERERDRRRSIFGCESVAVVAVAVVAVVVVVVVVVWAASCVSASALTNRVSRRRRSHSRVPRSRS
jgi:Flp pilus assembly protein TadB